MLQKRSLKNKTKEHFKAILAVKPNSSKSRRNRLCGGPRPNKMLVDKICTRPKPELRFLLPRSQHFQKEQEEEETLPGWLLRMESASFEAAVLHLPKRSCQDVPNRKKMITRKNFHFRHMEVGWGGDWVMGYIVFSFIYFSPNPVSSLKTSQKQSSPSPRLQSHRQTDILTDWLTDRRAPAAWRWCRHSHIQASDSKGSPDSGLSPKPHSHLPTDAETRDIDTLEVWTPLSL